MGWCDVPQWGQKGFGEPTLCGKGNFDRTQRQVDELTARLAKGCPQDYLHTSSFVF